MGASSLGFDDGDWRAVDLPHDWAIELPFVNDPALTSKGFYPLGRHYPEISVGWYRRVLEIPAADAGNASPSSSTGRTGNDGCFQWFLHGGGTAAMIRSSST
jgi:hypothetical protein